LLLFPNFCTDYIRAALAQDGLYIPRASYRFAASSVQGGEVSRTFRIYNVRPRRLAVEARPDCGCSAVSWTNTTIVPFGWKDLTAKVETDNKRSTSVSIALKTDSPKQPWLFIFLNS
jgi:hypothetical protein